MINLMLFLVCVFPFIGVLAESGMDQETDSELDVDNDTIDSDTEESSNSSDDINLASSAKSAIIIEASTGTVIFEKNANEPMAMASMTKMMSLLLIMENIESGNLKWDEMIVASANAASMGGSQIFLQVGEQMSVEDLVKGICIASGNDVVVSIKQSFLSKGEIII